MDPISKPGHRPPPVITVTEPDSPKISVAPLSGPISGRISIKSVQPIAASFPPGEIGHISEHAAAPVRAMRARRLAVAAALATLVIGGAVAARMHARTPSHKLTRDSVNGRAGLRTTPTGANEFWSPSQPPAFVLDPSLDRMGVDAKAAIVDGFTTWDSAKVGLPQATFSISSTAGEAVQDGVSRIVYAPITVAGYEDALGLTISYADESTGQIGESDVIFNSKYKFEVFPGNLKPGTACNGSYDVQNVATHETGHVYGLGEDMDDTTTTMYVHSSPCETTKRALTATDHQVMTALYAQVAAAASSSSAATSSQTPAGGCGGATVAPRGPSSGGGAAWLVGALAGLIWRRRRHVAT